MTTTMKMRPITILPRGPPRSLDIGSSPDSEIMIARGRHLHLVSGDGQRKTGVMFSLASAPSGGSNEPMKHTLLRFLVVTLFVVTSFFATRRSAEAQALPGTAP